MRVGVGVAAREAARTREVRLAHLLDTHERAEDVEEDQPEQLRALCDPVGLASWGVHGVALPHGEVRDEGGRRRPQPQSDAISGMPGIPAV